MPKSKRAEERTREMLKHYNWYWHKYGDVRYCMNCHVALPKSENAPDFSAGMVYTYIEAKNSDSSDTWQWSEISEEGARKNQRKWLLETGGWLFIELGSGNAPKGKSAYLVPFDQWVGLIEPQLIKNNMKSIRKETYRDRPGADTLLADFQLTWEYGGWRIPVNHVWWRILSMKLQLELERVEAHIHDEGN